MRTTITVQVEAAELDGLQSLMNEILQAVQTRPCMKCVSIMMREEAPPRDWSEYDDSA